MRLSQKEVIMKKVKYLMLVLLVTLGMVALTGCTASVDENGAEIEPATNTTTVAPTTSVASTTVATSTTATTSPTISHTPAVPTIPEKYGDCNTDGKINMADVLVLRKHLAKWDVKINTANADCNADTKINMADVLLLRKYLAKWDVVLGK